MPWTGDAPIVVAEALVRVRDPLLERWRLTPCLPDAAAAHIAASLGPAVAEDAPPPWLRSGQRETYRRTLVAVRRFGGALLADPVGTGKTWIGLAVAVRCAREVCAVVPAMLVSQWREVARRVGVPLAVVTHEAVSRGHRLPPAPIVIIDESHRFRNPDTRRYRTIAPDLVGRRVLLLSATPIVNQIADLTSQLRLALRDDALSPALASLDLPADQPAHHALADVVIAGRGAVGDQPTAHLTVLRPPEHDTSTARSLEALASLALSSDPAVRQLLRVSLWSALASSPAALTAALQRYRHLLLHAVDARRSGTMLDRRAIRSAVGDQLEQLVLWELLEPGAAGDLMLDDLPRVERMIEDTSRRLGRHDEKSERLAGLLRHGPPTLVFSSSIATVRWLCGRLGRGVAWCTGASAGIHGTPLPREVVLRCFAPFLDTDPALARPDVLLATDLAAEGLDLQRAGRVVHYDLPWTPVRLAQRVGRARRIGSLHQVVEVVRFEPHPALERCLRRAAIIAEKLALPTRVGVAPDADTPWTWRHRICTQLGRQANARSVYAEALSEQPGLLVAFRIRSGTRSAPVQLCRLTAKGWTDEAGPMADALMDAAERPSDVAALPPRRVPVGALRLAAVPVRRALSRAAAARWEARSLPDGGQTLLRRCHLLATAALVRHDQDGLGGIERALAFLRRGHTAGEAAAIREARSLTDDALWAWIASLPAPDPDPGIPEAEIIGIIRFRGRRRS